MPDGKLMIEKSVSDFNLKPFNKVYVVVLLDHIKKYVDRKLIWSLKKHIKKIRISDFKKATTCQAETVYQAIKKAKIKGGIVIKDSDNSFKCSFDKNLSNEIMVLNLNNIDLIEQNQNPM